MPLIYILKTAVTGLKTNKTRSALTILGIVIGIAAIIMVTALGKGAEALILNQLSGWGSRTISLEPGKTPDGPSDMAEIFTDSIRERDLEMLKKNAKALKIENVAPLVITSETLIYKSERFRGQVIGGTDKYMDYLNIYPETGIIFSEDSVKRRAKEAVIGYKVKEELFGFSDAVGEKVKIKDQWYRVVGVFPKSGTVGMQDIDKMILVPYSAAQKYLLGISHYHAILVQAKEEKDIAPAAEEIRQRIRELHNISDPDKDDFHVTTMDEAAEMIGVVTSVLTILLTSVATISLVVGGIGIMNIMLVSVTERTREIGLRKSLGATSLNIMLQFLLESVILTAVGGLIGIGLGAGMTYLIAWGVRNFSEYDWIFVFPIKGAIIGLGVSATVGLIFGLYPASQAAQKSPIEALRYE